MLGNCTAFVVSDGPAGPIDQKEFNFAMAMSMEGVGPAIAVGMRINENEELSRELSGLAPLQLNEQLAQVLEGTAELDQSYQIVVFGLLYGQPEAKLYTIVELHPWEASIGESAVKEPYRYICVTTLNPILGENGWKHENWGLVQRKFTESLKAIARLINSRPPALMVENAHPSIKGDSGAEPGPGPSRSN